MSQSCPRCQTAIAPTALQCPSCGLPLKAHGHPGIPLHHSEGSQSLCVTCRYDADNSCSFPQRPHAQTCTLYRSQQPDPTMELPSLSPGQHINLWLRRHRGLIALAGLLVVSLAWVLIQN